MEWLVAAITAGAALGGVFLQARLESARRERESHQQTAAEKLARVREHELQRIDQSRSSVIGQLDFAWTVAQGDRGRALRLRDDVGQYLRADPRLMGEPELLRAWAVLVLRLLKKFPHGRLEKAVWPLLKRRTDYDDLDAVTTVRSRMIMAFEAQERRALMDEPLIFPSTEEVAAIVELERITERLRELLG